MVLMIIKGLFRRYERWNPVHPTSGAFWGMGVGIGCGVGWGPGFGPEVISYVGAGCGVGFSVGITLAGVGIGLPANSLFEGPYNAIVATKKGALDFARFSGLLSIKDAAGDGWNNLAPQISGWQREANGRLSSFNHKHKLDRLVDASNMKNMLHVHANSIWKSLGAFGGQIIRPRKDSKD